jgi:hypothetical protein
VTENGGTLTAGHAGMPPWLRLNVVVRPQRAEAEMGLLQTSRDRLDLSDAMRFIGAKWTDEPHIVFARDLKPQYRIRRASSHDGTVLFSMQLMHKALTPLFERSS